MRLRRKYQSSDELVDSIIRRPVEAFFSIEIKSELLKRVNENAGDMADAACEIANDIGMLLLCVLRSLAHIGEFLLYPLLRIVWFARIRRKVIREERIVKIKCEMFGGPYKYVSEEWDDMKGKGVPVYETGDIPYTIKLTITEK